MSLQPVLCATRLHQGQVPPARRGGARLLTGTVCSQSGHLVLPQVTWSKKSFLQGWRSLNPYYALTGIWHHWLEMDIHSWTHCNKGRTFFWVVFVVVQILKLWSIIRWIVKCPQSLNTFTSSPCSSLLWLSVLFLFPPFPSWSFKSEPALISCSFGLSRGLGGLVFGFFLFIGCTVCLHIFVLKCSFLLKAEKKKKIVDLRKKIIRYVLFVTL